MSERVNNFPRSFAFRLTDADGERLDAVAAADGTTSGEWARKVISRALGIAYARRAVRRRVANADLLRSILGELGRQGGNLNQIARHCNSGSSLDKQALGLIDSIRLDVGFLLKRIVAALGGMDEP